MIESQSQNGMQIFPPDLIPEETREDNHRWFFRFGLNSDNWDIDQLKALAFSALVVTPYLAFGGLLVYHSHEAEAQRVARDSQLGPDVINNTEAFWNALSKCMERVDGLACQRQVYQRINEQLNIK